MNKILIMNPGSTSTKYKVFDDKGNVLEEYNYKITEVDMAEVMRLFDGAVALLPCVTYRFYERCDECIDEDACGIREVFLEIRNETVERLKAATLEDIINRETRLKTVKR